MTAVVERGGAKAQRHRSPDLVFSQAVYNTPDALTQVDCIEVDEESEAMAGSLQVREQLRFVKGQQLLDRLEFQHQGIVYEHIDATGADCVPLVANFHRYLAAEWNTLKP